MTIWVCEGMKGCYKPCELNDYQEGISDPPEIGYCRFSGHPVKWSKVQK